ncbi:MAG: Divalent-cation tolerance protein CutA [Syntrophorhabdus sp. PtaB.Bin047]|jgi:periplasmic divalent cation tolerance protein|nr:MAG: Divalent-cation tolerance protein CutA [Syntrophorhabdus sp. PtaB.Bin047]
MPDIIQIVTTIDDREAAERMGKRLVGERLVACCQIVGPIRSIYRWKGNVEEADEWCCVMKTRPSLYRQVEGAIKRLHPYEVPEIVATPVSTALPDYARWVESETS